MIRRIVIAAFSGLLLGLLVFVLQGPRYQAQVTVYLPGVQPQLFLNLTRALRADPSNPDNLQSLTAGSPESATLAGHILRSGVAAEKALQGESLGPERARQQWSKRFKLENLDGGSLRLSVTGRSADLSRAALNNALEYYADFVKKNPLSRVGSTRRVLEEKLKATSKGLKATEEKLAQSSSRELRNLGESILKVDPKVLAQVRVRRIDEQQESRALLNRLKKLRTSAENVTSPQETEWTEQWLGGNRHFPLPEPGLARLPVRAQDLSARAQLERAYYEGLLKYRAQILQHAFLSTWEALESRQFEIIDPVSVRDNRTPLLWWAGVGALFGVILGMFWPTKRRR